MEKMTDLDKEIISYLPKNNEKGITATDYRKAGYMNEKTSLISSRLISLHKRGLIHRSYGRIIKGKLVLTYKLHPQIQ